MSRGLHALIWYTKIGKSGEKVQEPLLCRGTWSIGVGVFVDRLI